MSDDFATGKIGVSTCCVYRNGLNVLFIERNIRNFSHDSTYIYIYISLHIKNYFSMNITNT
jgi:hypothetical protein